MNVMADAFIEFDDLPEQLKSSLFIRVFRELQHVQDNPRLAVLIAHGFIELLVNAVVDAKCKNAKKITENHRDFPHSAKLVILHEMELINDFRFKSLDWFRKLRNRAAHEPLFEVSAEELAAQFNQITVNERAKPDGTPGITAHGIGQLCMIMIVTFWSDHSRLLSPVFFPQEIAVKKSPTDADAPKESPQ
jgi:hypothetical protein